MSHPTPRKSRHRHQPSGGGGARTVAASDYESDAAQYMGAPDLPPPSTVARLSNTELNLSVLRRYLPSIRSIVSIAANAVVYTISPTTGQWEKSGVEGTLFVCEQEPVVDLAGHVLPRACVFILNRRGLENLVIHLCNTSACEVVGELINFYVEDKGDATAAAAAEALDVSAGNGQDNRVIGLWIHADKDDTRQVNADVILSLWNQCRLAITQSASEDQEGGEAGVADTGRSISMAELFGQSNGASRR
ncbi:hypothetical protein GE09DRAFT_615986 [Coniochaeta sp. 2T2.1]|nr:hypothetical protein GE09DRAFT_615986 [Coniochaeta sp. 2T2.1]